MTDTTTTTITVQPEVLIDTQDGRSRRRWIGGPAMTGCGRC
jgi:hypothetical protein